MPHPIGSVAVSEGVRPHRVAHPEADARLRAVAQELETQFLAEMLKSAGVGDTRETFGGGVGEEQFSSFLREAQAEQMVRAGGIGLTERLFQSLKARQDG